MKKVILSLLVGSVLFVSCKKDDAPTDCAETVAAVAGTYKITKVTSAGFDVTSTYLDACNAAATYQLNADKTVVYTETGATCTGSGTGNWDITGSEISISHSGGGQDVQGTVSNNCSNVTASFTFGGASLVVTLTKQ